MGWYIYIWVFPKRVVGPLNHPHLFIGFGTIIFTIHFGGKIPLFLVQHPYIDHQIQSTRLWIGTYTFDSS